MEMAPAGLAFFQSKFLLSKVRLWSAAGSGERILPALGRELIFCCFCWREEEIPHPPNVNLTKTKECSFCYKEHHLRKGLFYLYITVRKWTSSVGVSHQKQLSTNPQEVGTTQKIGSNIPCPRICSHGQFTPQMGLNSGVAWVLHHSEVPISLILSPQIFTDPQLFHCFLFLTIFCFQFLFVLCFTIMSLQQLIALKCTIYLLYRNDLSFQCVLPVPFTHLLPAASGSWIFLFLFLSMVTPVCLYHS